MIKKLGIIIVINIILIWLSVRSMHLDQSVFIGIIFFVSFLFISNIIAGFILKAFKNGWANAILINSIISSIIFYNFSVHAINKQTTDNSKQFYFQTGGKNYELFLNVVDGKYQDNENFEVYGRGEGSSWGIGLAGKYSFRDDTLFLVSDSSKKMKVSNNFLFDYPKVGDRIKLQLR